MARFFKVQLHTKKLIYKADFLYLTQYIYRQQADLVFLLGYVQACQVIPISGLNQSYSRILITPVTQETFNKLGLFFLHAYISKRTKLKFNFTKYVWLHPVMLKVLENDISKS